MTPHRSNSLHCTGWISIRKVRTPVEHPVGTGWLPRLIAWLARAGDCQDQQGSHNSLLHYGYLNRGSVRSLALEGGEGEEGIQWSFFCPFSLTRKTPNQTAGSVPLLRCKAFSIGKGALLFKASPDRQQQCTGTCPRSLLLPSQQGIRPLG